MGVGKFEHLSVSSRSRARALLKRVLLLLLLLLLDFAKNRRRFRETRRQKIGRVQRSAETFLRVVFSLSIDRSKQPSFTQPLGAHTFYRFL